MSNLTISPDRVNGTSAVATQSLPAWAQDVLTFVSQASAEGETVELNTRVETLTPAQVANRLGISRATVSRRIADGDIRTIKVGNRHRIPVAEYARYRQELLTMVVSHYADDIETDLLD